ncbi:unnamed protein product [Clonostachys chloroleuca]|uniref:TauD/TfdA-like domain-containing protein n=1 Tax=Clonostachys chloroleuca TaxID=1926264 RepID=A0AA35Q522_9HYPO|nr:unnamed protein product [Clonostachys chloroleuca]
MTTDAIAGVGPRLIREPFRSSGSLDMYQQIQVTPLIGTEFPKLQVTDILWDNQKIRDLAIMASERGVLFFRNQQITPLQQKILTDKLGILTAKPITSNLHRHGVFNKTHGVAIDQDGNLDDYILPVSTEITRKVYTDKWTDIPPIASTGWHTDIVYNPVASDYAVIHAVSIPEDGSGGDTIWASGYEVYDRLSPPMKALFDGMTGLQQRTAPKDVLLKHGLPVMEEIKENYSHPIVRTNPVTGWKGIFGIGAPLKIGGINGVTNFESEVLQDYLFRLIVENHDLQVRFQWTKNDLVIWDNRSCFHTATNDYKGHRHINLCVSHGEVPYYDPASKSRREALFEINN